MESFASGFAVVDKTSDANSFIQYLDLIHSLLFSKSVKTKYKKLNLSLGDLVLELGCGNRVDVKNLANIVESSGKVVGIDISSTILKSAQVTSQTTNSCPEFMPCDGQYFAFPDGALMQSDQTV